MSNLQHIHNQTPCFDFWTLLAINNLLFLLNVSQAFPNIYIYISSTLSLYISYGTDKNLFDNQELL